MTPPSLETDRLLLRSFHLGDAPEVQRLAGDVDIASTTLEIPHPYEDGIAEEWISTHKERYDRGEFVCFAIVLKQSNTLIGSISLTIEPKHDRCELGYWIGKPYWGNGYCTEAANAIICFGFDVMKLNRIYSHHMIRNPASGRVLEKLGMNYEGYSRQHVKKFGVYEDIRLYSMLYSEYRGLWASS